MKYEYEELTVESKKRVDDFIDESCEVFGWKVCDFKADISRAMSRGLFRAPFDIEVVKS